jgi:hypothetical protein
MSWLSDLDRILRGEATRLSSLRQGKIELKVGGLSVGLLILGLFYGLCMGSFALFKGGAPSFLQAFASMIKVPLLIFLTLEITFPSLYVFNALVGSRLSADVLFRLLIASLAVMMAVLASFGPIVAFFSASTTSYPFMQLFNVVIFGISGFLGLKFLLSTLHRLTVVRSDTPSTAVEPPRPRVTEESALNEVPIESSSVERVEPQGALDHLEDQVLGPNVKTVFRLWVIVFGLVGAQMSWVLRPFIGNPYQPFEWFRPRSSNFFEALWGILHKLFS